MIFRRRLRGNPLATVAPCVDLARANSYWAERGDPCRLVRPHFLQRSLSHPALEALNAWYIAHVPALNTI
jgi:hypothetical protein